MVLVEVLPTLKLKKNGNTSCIVTKMMVVAGYYRNPSDPPEIPATVVVQSHLSKVGQNDLSDVRLKEVL